MRRFQKIMIMLTMFFVLTGCWNNCDLTDLAIMTGIAIDKSSEGKIEMTVQIVKPQVIKPDPKGGAKESKAYVNISSTGETMFDATRNLLARLNKKAYFAHVQLIVISEEAAREGISSYFDLFERDIETRRRANLVIAKGMKARTVLDSESRLTNLPTTHNIEAFEASRSYGKSLNVLLLNVLKDFSKEGYAIVLPVLVNSKKTEDVYQEELIMEGSAIMKKDKLIGYLDPIQTRGYLFSKDEIQSTIINIPSPLNPDKKVSIEVIRSTGKIEAKMEKGKPILDIKVKAEGNIGEQQEKEDLTKLDTIQALEYEVENEIKKEIESTVKITQEEYHSDVFGFINNINKNYYTEWKRIVNYWSDIYSGTPVEVNVKFEIRRPGLNKQPIEQK